jgi:peroxiredoxin
MMTTGNPFVTPSLLLMAALLSLQALATPPKKGRVSVTPPQAAPAFTAKDVNGKEVNLSDYKGRKVLLTFFRNAGCPVCNLRMHELLARAAAFERKGLTVIAVYESTAQNLRQYTEGQSIPFVMIPDASQQLYSRYAIERSGRKAFASLFHGVMGKAGRGKKLFRRKTEQDGHKTTIGADFLIDEHGKVAVAHYGRYIGDHLPLNEIDTFLNQ